MCPLCLMYPPKPVKINWYNSNDEKEGESIFVKYLDVKTLEHFTCVLTFKLTMVTEPRIMKTNCKL